MDTLPVIALGEIVSIVTAVILFFLGLQSWIKSLKAEDNISIKQLRKRSIILLGSAIICYSVSRFFVFLENNPQIELNEGLFLSLCMTSLFQGIKNTGFIIFLPVLIKAKKK